MQIDGLFVTDSSTKNNNRMVQISMGDFFENDYSKPMLFELAHNKTYGLTVLNVFPMEILTKEGIVNARRQFLRVLERNVNNYIPKVVLLAASTKRLFGKEIELRVNQEGNLDDSGFTLREQYPDLLFTNGDNGTSVILEMEIESVLEREKIKSGNENLCNYSMRGYQCSGSVIINGLGLLGTNSLLQLINKQFCDKQVIIISNHTKELDSIIGKKNVSVFSNIKEIQNHCCLGNNNHVKLIVNCTHHPSQMITADSIAHIQNGQVVNVIDVAVPYGFPEDEFLKCSNVIRQDGGNAFVENGLMFYFNPEICGLTENVLYGCFAEAVVLTAYLKENPEEYQNLRCYDFFNVNIKTKNFVKGLFDKYGIGIAPKPYNFMKVIKQ
jgi:hypothetical protein